MKDIAILGSTGSIGRQALEVAAANPERFRIRALAAGANADLLAEQARLFRPEMVAMADAAACARLRRELDGTGIAVLCGPEGVAEAGACAAVDLTLVALVGAAGIPPTLAAIEAGKDIALANKEALVAAGGLVMERARGRGVRLIPVDSEHAAIHQCLAGLAPREVQRIILTASGGPFRAWTAAALREVTVAQALKHPNWRMGEKVTIDSATLFNKGLEVIEAHWLFGLDFDRIDVLVHAESIVHALVETIDGAVFAQLGAPDMRLPIAYALAYPERLAASWPVLPTLAGMQLTFIAPDRERFPALDLAYEMGRRGGTFPAVMSAANETAVAAFLRGELRFTDIVGIVADVCGQHGGGEASLAGIMAADAWGRARAAELCRQKRE
ncbi:MAG: 1-deoxy-D-xylulose-5-phosphate reductoisomerase [Patescibacteria group bacterium]